MACVVTTACDHCLHGGSQRQIRGGNPGVSREEATIASLVDIACGEDIDFLYRDRGLEVPGPGDPMGQWERCHNRSGCYRELLCRDHGLVDTRDRPGNPASVGMMPQAQWVLCVASIDSCRDHNLVIIEGRSVRWEPSGQW